MDESENLRKNVDDMMNNLIEKNEDILKEIHPDLISDYKNLKKSIKD